MKTEVKLAVEVESGAPVPGSARWLSESLSKHKARMVIKGGTVYLLYPEYRTSKGVLNPLWKRIAWLKDGKVQVPSEQANEFTPARPLEIPLCEGSLGDLQPAALAAYLELEREAAKLLQAKAAEDDNYKVALLLS